MHRRRLVTIGLLLCLLAVLSYYGYRAYPEVRLIDCLRDPERFDGVSITVGNEAKVWQIVEDGFVVRQMGRLVRVQGDPGTARVGDFVRFQAQFHRDGHLTLQRLYVAKRRRAKVAISLLPALLVAVLVVRSYRFDRRRLCFVERRQCQT
ncbi:MAG: hypothetical protein H5U38_13265 [Calditrichaeota bacterium]|nr:hypothetical protein [Calditrichota bacterium]